MLSLLVLYGKRGDLANLFTSVDPKKKKITVFVSPEKKTKRKKEEKLDFRILFSLFFLVWMTIWRLQPKRSRAGKKKVLLLKKSGQLEGEGSAW